MSPLHVIDSQSVFGNCGSANVRDPSDTSAAPDGSLCFFVTGHFAASLDCGGFGSVDAAVPGFGLNTPRRSRTTTTPIARTHPAKIIAICPVVSPMGSPAICAKTEMVSRIMDGGSPRAFSSTPNLFATIANGYAQNIERVRTPHGMEPVLPMNRECALLVIRSKIQQIAE